MNGIGWRPSPVCRCGDVPLPIHAVGLENRYAGRESALAAKNSAPGTDRLLYLCGMSLRMTAAELTAETQAALLRAGYSGPLEPVRVAPFLAKAVDRGLLAADNAEMGAPIADAALELLGTTGAGVEDTGRVALLVGTYLLAREDAELGAPGLTGWLGESQVHRKLGALARWSSEQRAGDAGEGFDIGDDELDWARVGALSHAAWVSPRFVLDALAILSARLSNATGEIEFDIEHARDEAERAELMALRESLRDGEGVIADAIRVVYRVLGWPEVDATDGAIIEDPDENLPALPPEELERLAASIAAQFRIYPRHRSAFVTYASRIGRSRAETKLQLVKAVLPRVYARSATSQEVRLADGSMRWAVPRDLPAPELASWLKTAALSAACELLATEPAPIKGVDPDLDPDALDGGLPFVDLPDLGARLDALRGLTVREQRFVRALLEHDNGSIAAAGRALGMTENSARQMLWRIRQKLRPPDSQSSSDAA